MDVDHLAARVNSSRSSRRLFASSANANREIELLIVTHSGSSAFRKCRQLRILGAQEFACAFICIFFVLADGGDLDHGLRDGSGCGNLFGSTTHGLGSKMRNGRQHEPNASQIIELAIVVHSVTSAFRIQ